VAVSRNRAAAKGSNATAVPGMGTAVKINIILNVIKFI